MFSGASTALPKCWLWQEVNTSEASKLSPGPRQVLPSSQRWGAQGEKEQNQWRERQEHPPRMIPLRMTTGHHQEQPQTPQWNRLSSSTLMAQQDLPHWGALGNLPKGLSTMDTHPFQTVCSNTPSTIRASAIPPYQQNHISWKG